MQSVGNSSEMAAFACCNWEIVGDAVVSLRPVSSSLNSVAGIHHKLEFRSNHHG